MEWDVYCIPPVLLPILHPSLLSLRHNPPWTTSQASISTCRRFFQVYSASNRTSASWRDLLFQRNFGKKKACIIIVLQENCASVPPQSSAVVWECRGEKSCVTPTRKGGEYSSLPHCTRTQNKIECCRRFYPGEFLIKQSNANEPE